MSRELQAVMWLDDATLRGRSAGAIETPETYNYRTFLPEKGGLYDVGVFGPVPWPLGTMAMHTDPRVAHWGHLELDAPVHRADGPPRAVVMVPPPVFRRFTLHSPEEAAAEGRARRARLVALDASGSWPYCDPLEKVLAEQGLSAPHHADQRGRSCEEPPLNAVYRSVVNLRNRLRAFARYDAPEAVRGECREQFARACGRLDGELRVAGLPEAVLALALGRSEAGAEAGSEAPVVGSPPR